MIFSSAARAEDSPGIGGRDKKTKQTNKISCLETSERIGVWKTSILSD